MKVQFLHVLPNALYWPFPFWFLFPTVVTVTRFVGSTNTPNNALSRNFFHAQSFFKVTSHLRNDITNIQTHKQTNKQICLVFLGSLPLLLCCISLPEKKGKKREEKTTETERDGDHNHTVIGSFIHSWPH